MNAEISDLAAGKAGEYLVCADLALQGHIAFLSEQGLPYDVVADIEGRLFKLQVKTTRSIRSVSQRAGDASGYLFHVGRCGKGGRGRYGASDVDLFALVALDSKTIGYVKAGVIRRTMLLRADANFGTHYDEVIENRRLSVHADKASGLLNHEIADKHGMDRSVVTRTLRRNSANRAGIYLSDLTLTRALLASNDNLPGERAVS